MMRFALSSAFVMLFLTSVPGLSQTVLDTREGQVEIIGLREWTAQMLQDSVAVRAPEVSLASYACAAVLRSEFGFADASVAVYPAALGRGDRDYIVITLVEPRDSARVRYRPEPTEKMPDRPEWHEAIRVLREHSQDFQAALQRYGYLSQLTHGDSAETTSEGLQLRSFLRAHQSEDDLGVALEVLSKDGNHLNRAIAAAILGSFHERDSSWWALADALRDQVAMVSGTAGQVLSILSRQFARPVNWSPVAEELRFLLDGTNLFAHNTIMQVLAATQVEPALAPALLRGGGDLILAKVRSADPSGKPAAIRLLTQLSGHDFGTDAAAWETWIGSL